MTPEIHRIMDESIAFELLVSDLYLLFHEVIAEDAQFWWTLSLEERNHAALIESIKNSFSDPEDLSYDLFLHHIDVLIKANENIRELIGTLRAKPPSRDYALRLALDLEQSSVESRFQKMMSQNCPGGLTCMIQQLNRNDKDHAQRIRTYMADRGIS